MIAAVKRWLAALPAFLYFIPWCATAADDAAGAARELARKTAAFAGKGATVAVTWRNRTTLDAAGTQVRSSFEADLQEAGLHVTEIAPTVEVRITVSESASQFLLVEEAARGDEHEVWIASWKRTETGAVPGTAGTLEKRLLWEQDEPILDVALPPAGMLVLSPANVTLYARAGTGWQRQKRLALSPAKPWPRDLRGHLRLKGATFQVLLPGLKCEGTTDPDLSMQCAPSDDPWVLESGSRALLLADFAPGRNYFDGRVTTQAGQRKSVPPFFSAASVESQGQNWWLLALIDGRTQILDGALDPAGFANTPWGSDIAGTDARCWGGSQILATGTGDRSQADSLQAFAMVDKNPQSLTDAIEFPGPIVALWTFGGSGAVVVVHDLRTGKYAAYVVSIVCGG